MHIALPHEELQGVRDRLGDLVGALEVEAPVDPATLELLALEIQAPFAVPGAPPELLRELPRALHARGDAFAVDLLAAIERLAPQPLAGFASVARDRLESAGVAPALPGLVGMAAVAEASVLAAPDGGAEIWRAVLTRPGSDRAQALVVFVENEHCGPVIVGATVTVPEAPEAVRELLPDVAPDGRRAEPLEPDELARRLRSALDHMERHEVPLDADAATSLPLLERALTGAAGRLPRPPIEEPDGEELDEEAELRAEADALVDAFADALEDDGAAEPALRDHGPFVAHCMLDWKLGYGDGRLERWTLGDLRELLLDWFPRKVTADDETIAVAADAVAAFLRFLAARDRLDAPVPLASLEAAVARLRRRFEEACRERGNWGLAKSMVARMAEDGVDPSDPEAVDDWIEQFNARPFDDRDGVVGAAADSMLAAAGPAPAQKRAKRKAARQARKRNRR